MAPPEPEPDLSSAHRPKKKSNRCKAVWEMDDGWHACKRKYGHPSGRTDSQRAEHVCACGSRVIYNPPDPFFPNGKPLPAAPDPRDEARMEGLFRGLERQVREEAEQEEEQDG